MNDSTVPKDLSAKAVARGERPSLARRLLKNPTALASLLVLTVVVIAAIVAPWISPWDPNRADLAQVLAPPFGEHVLGADSAGRDILTRLLFGARVSLIGAAIALSVALIFGLPTGLIAGYYQGWFDSLSNWLASLIMAMPGLIVLLALISVVGPGIVGVMATFGALLSPGVFRLTRSGVISVRNELYIDAAIVSGLSDVRILARHVFGVIRAPLVIQASMMAGIAIILQAGLEFLGVGDSSTASWGQMLNDAFVNIYIAPAMLIWPGLIIAITVGALALFGAALRDTVQGTEAQPAKRLSTPASITKASCVGNSVPPLGSAEPPIEASGDSLLYVRNLRVGYFQPDGSTKVVVNDVSLHVDRGEVLGLVGESGSGKSQTAFSILGLLSDGGHVTSGQIFFDGREIASTGSSMRGVDRLRGRRIGYIPQEPMSNLDPCFTLGFQLIEPMRRILKLNRQDATQRALDLLDRVGIADPSRTFNAYPHEVSGGMAQRVLIAGAIACDPELLIADEPTTALDVTVQADVLDLLRELQRERNMGMIMVTHNFGVVADICDRVAVMQNGRLVEQNEAVELFDNPQHSYTRMLLGSTLEDTAARAPLNLIGATQ